MSNEMQVFTPDVLSMFAGPVAKSNMLGTKSPDDVMAIMMIAQAEGRHPGSIIQEYHIINGKPTLKADAILARFQKAGGKVNWLTYTDTAVKGVFSHAQGGELTLEWTIEQAQKAGLTKNPVWGKYPRAMLRSRVASEAIRTIFPSVLGGAYSSEEAMDFEAAPINNGITLEQKTLVSNAATELGWTKEEFQEKLGISSTAEITSENWPEIKLKLNIKEN